MHPPHISSWRAEVREREKWLLSFSALLSGTLWRALSQSAWGEDIQQRKNLSHYIVFCHRELVSLPSRSQSVFLFLFFYTSLISRQFIFSYFSVVLPILSIYFSFYISWSFEALTLPFEHASLSKTRRGQREARDSSEQQREDCLKSKQTSVRSDRAQVEPAPGQRKQYKLTCRTHSCWFCIQGFCTYFSWFRCSMFFRPPLLFRQWF